MEIRLHKKTVHLPHGPSSLAETDVIGNRRQFFWRLPILLPEFYDKGDKKEGF